MSSADVQPADAPETPGAEPHGTFDWTVARRQVVGVLRLELRKNLLSRRAFVLYFLAFAPVALMALWAVSPVPREYLSGPMDASRVYAGTFAGYLGTSIFLGCLVLFTSLFRSELLERSLHYYFLTPIRREVLVVGKYLSALLAIGVVFVLGTVALYVVTLGAWGLGELSRYLFGGPGLSSLASYVGISLLACVGYGALFLLTGLLFRNPVVPAAVIWGWEVINFLLPSWLKKVSVVFYLKSLYPIPVSEGPFSILADPTPAWVSVPGLLLFTAGVLALASWRLRRLEITYGSDD